VNEASIIFRVCGGSLSDDLFRPICDKQFFASNINALAPVALVNLCGVILEPGKVTLIPLTLRPRFSQFFRVTSSITIGNR
jgi:hypothetical protein